MDFFGLGCKEEMVPVRCYVVKKDRVKHCMCNMQKLHFGNDVELRAVSDHRRESELECG